MAVCPPSHFCTWSSCWTFKQCSGCGCFPSMYIKCKGKLHLFIYLSGSCKNIEEYSEQDFFCVCRMRSMRCYVVTCRTAWLRLAGKTWAVSLFGLHYPQPTSQHGHSWAVEPRWSVIGAKTNMDSTVWQKWLGFNTQSLTPIKCCGRQKICISDYCHFAADGLVLMMPRSHQKVEAPTQMLWVPAADGAVFKTVSLWNHTGIFKYFNGRESLHLYF